MSYFLRILGLATVLMPAALLAAGCNGATGGVGAEESPRPADATNIVTKAAAVPAEAAAAAKPAPNQVIIDNFAFRPQVLTVAAGTRVTWINQDDVPHTATSTARPRVFASGTLDTDGRFDHVFTKPGTYEYFCAVHPHMTGKIIVK
jgi:plastocyanin